MGKRELVLILAFALVGVVTYQLSAPAAQPGERGFSFSRIIEDLRSHLDLDQARAVRRLEANWAVPAEVHELRIVDFNGAVRILAEERSDITADLTVEVFGADLAQAQAAAERVDLAFDIDGGAVVVGLRSAGSRRPRGTLSLLVPRRLSGRLGGAPGPLEARGLAEVTLDGRGEVVLSDVSGAVTGEHRSGDVRISGAARVELTTRQSDIRLVDIRGDVLVHPNGGSVSVRRIAGELRVEGRRADIEAEDVGGPIALVTSDGVIDLRGVRTSTTIDARQTDVSLELAQAAPVKVTNVRDDVALVVPAGMSLTLDARATEGTIRVEDGLDVVLTGTARERRAHGDLEGGGPEVALDVTRGDIVIRGAPPAASTTP
jgi:hypothetical protein